MRPEDIDQDFADMIVQSLPKDDQTHHQVRAILYLFADGTLDEETFNNNNAIKEFVSDNQDKLNDLLVVYGEGAKQRLKEHITKENKKLLEEKLDELKIESATKKCDVVYFPIKLAYNRGELSFNKLVPFDELGVVFCKIFGDQDTCFGHLDGLHDSLEEAEMYHPSAVAYNLQFMLFSNDILGIRVIYQNPNVLRKKRPEAYFYKIAEGVDEIVVFLEKAGYHNGSLTIESAINYEYDDLEGQE